MLPDSPAAGTKKLGALFRSEKDSSARSSRSMLPRSGEQPLQLAAVCTTCETELMPEKTVNGRPEYQRKIPASSKPPTIWLTTGLAQSLPHRFPLPKGSSKVK